MTGDQRPLDISKQLTERLDVDLVLQATGFGLWELNPVTNQVFCDDRCQQLFGIDQHQISYSDTLHHVHPEDVERVNRAVTLALNPQSDGAYQVTYRTTGKEDRTRWIQSTGRRYIDPSGQTVRFAGVAQDVTQQLEAYQQAQRQQRISDSSPDLMYVFDLSYRFTYANQALLDMWGKSREEAIGKGLLENGYEPWHAQMHEREIDQVVATKQSIRGEVSFPHATLGKRIYDYVLAPVLNEQGEVEAVAGTTRDITAIKQAHQLAQQSEARFRSLIEEAPVATMLMVGPEHTIEVVNEVMLHMLGKGPSIIGQPATAGVPELASQAYLQVLNQVYATGNPYSAKAMPGELVINGVAQLRYFDFTYKPQRNLQGQVYGIISMAVDVTEQRQAQQALQESKQFLQSVIDLAELGSYTIDVTSYQMVKSPRVAQWYGLPEQTDVESSLNAILESDRERIGQVLAQALEPGTPGSYQVEYTVINRQTGTRHILRTNGQVRRNEDGQPLRIEGTVMDITDQRALQLMLEQQVQRRTEELAAANKALSATNEEYAVLNKELAKSNSLLVRSNENLQTFAYVASHDLQEPLRKIQQFGDLLKTRYADSVGEELTYLERMQSAAKRMSTLIKDLLDFSRISTQRDASGTVALDAILKQVLSTLELTLQETGAQVELDPLPKVQGDASQLTQLFQNLLSNAIKFRRPGVVPHVVVKASWLTADHLPETFKLGRETLAYHQIDVSDNGIGFDEKYVDRIFQVFQRLHGKNEYAGTGIGLAICERVVTNHGGAITAKSQPGQGATFMIYLPA